MAMGSRMNEQITGHTEPSTREQKALETTAFLSLTGGSQTS